MLRSVAGSVERGGVERAASNGAASNGAGLTGPRDCCSAAQVWAGGQAGDIARAALVLAHFEHGDIT